MMRDTRNAWHSRATCSRGLRCSGPSRPVNLQPRCPRSRVMPARPVDKTRHAVAKGGLRAVAGHGLQHPRIGAGGFTNPLGLIDDRFETRPERDAGEGGEVESQQFFRGDAAFFGGIEWQATDRLRLTAEYSPDAYPREDPFAFERATQLNFGATYRIGPMTDLSLRYLYGSEIGVQISTALDPKLPTPTRPGATRPRRRFWCAARIRRRRAAGPAALPGGPACAAASPCPSTHKA